MQKKIEKVSETNEIRVRNLTNSNNTHSYTQSHIEARTNLSSWSGGYFWYRGGWWICRLLPHQSEHRGSYKSVWLNGAIKFQLSLNLLLQVQLSTPCKIVGFLIYKRQLWYSRKQIIRFHSLRHLKQLHLEHLPEKIEESSPLSSLFPPSSALSRIVLRNENRLF